MTTGIVILNYNDYETTIKMIKQIKNYKVLDHILIVDNHSTDDSLKKLQSFNKDNIEVVCTNANDGYAAGNNFGAKYLIDKYHVDNIIISNPDVIVSEDVIKSLIDDLANNEVSLVAPVILENGNRIRGWKVPKFIDDLGSNIIFFHRFFKKRIFYKDYYYDSDLVKVDCVHGCFFAIKSKVLKHINYFDPNTFLYYEENILGKKLLNKGYESYIDITLEVKHDLSVSVDKNVNRIKKYKLLKTSQKYYEKEYNNINIFKMFLLRGTYYTSLALAYIINLVRR